MYLVWTPLQGLDVKVFFFMSYLWLAYANIIDFYILILCLVVWQNSCIYSNNLSVDSFRFSKYAVLSFVKNNELIFFFLILYTQKYFPSSLLSLGPRHRIEFLITSYPQTPGKSV